MKTVASLTTFAVALQALAVEGKLDRRQSSLIIDTPTTGVFTCETTQISFRGGVAPYFVSVFPGNTQANAYIQFSPVSASPLKWNVNIASGTSITLGIRDSDGNTNAAAAVTIADGTTDDCVNITSSTTGTETQGSGGDTTGSSPTTGAATTGDAATTGGSPTTDSSSPGATETTTTGAAGAGMAVSGLLAAGAAALAFL